MSRSEYDIPSPLLRQRRNAFAVSFLIVFLAVTGAEIKSAGFVGLVQLSEFSSPHFLILLWIMYFYFLLRFVVYVNFQAEAPLRTLVRDFKKDTINTRLSTAAVSRWNEQYEGALYPSGGGTWIFPEGMTAGEAYLMFGREFHVVFRVLDGQGNGVEDVNVRGIELPRTWLIFLHLRALYNALFRYPYATDYYLPALLYLLALYIGASFDWDGSFASLVMNS